MKVFGCKCNYELGGGVILVAAKNKLQAYCVAISNDGTRWLFEQTETVGFESNFYPYDKWQEMKHLSTRLTEPSVIIEDHYYEKHS